MSAEASSNDQRPKPLHCRYAVWLHVCMAPGTTLRNVRINDELWEAAQQRAAQQGVSVSDVIRDHLASWAYPVDSATHTCCKGIGRHTPACRP